MKSIVVGLNGTKSSFAAVDWAAERAARGAPRVEIVMIAGTMFSAGNRLCASIMEAERRVRERAPEAQIAWRRFPGRMPESLFEHAQAADLIVVGCHRRHVGSSTATARLPSRIASGSRVPVVVVPDDWSRTDRPIVVGFDADGSSDAALDVAAREAAAACMTLLIVHACPSARGENDDPLARRTAPDHDRSEHGRALREAAIQVNRVHPAVIVEQVLVDGDPAEVLLDYGQSASLIVLGTRHTGLFVGAILGSIGQQVLPRARVPICIVPDDRVSAPPPLVLTTT